MGKSNSRKKQDRAKTAARRAEQQRRRAKAVHQRQSVERYERLSDPSASPADIAEILAVDLRERVFEDGQIVWWGEPAGDRDDDKEEHVVLGRLTPEPGRIRARVNSQARLKRLLRILKEIGAAPNSIPNSLCKFHSGLSPSCLARTLRRPEP